MCIKEIDMIGKSKREAKENGIKGIHSYKTKKEVLKISKQFANWARAEHSIKNLHDLTEIEYKAFLDSKSHTTADYRRGIETHLRLLQEGLNKRSERFGKEMVQFTTENRLIASRNRLEGISDRSMSLKDINTLKINTSENVRNSIELMHNLGLRVSGSVSVKVENVNFGSKKVYVTEKGGRSRYVSIPKGFEKALAEMVEGKNPEDRIVNITARAVQNEVNKVSKKLGIKNTGTHAFRHTYARNRVEQLMTEEEKNLFDKCISRYAENKNFDYGVKNRELYNSVKSKMDQIHRELGHGKNRFDLAVRYMKK